MTKESTPEQKAKPTRILGISCFYHNSAASLIVDGKIAAAAEEERFTRVKADRRFPTNAINYCLEEGQIDGADLDAVVYYDTPELSFERLLHTAVEGGENSSDLWIRMMPSWLQYKLHIPSLITNFLKTDVKVLREAHHRSHVAAAFYPSPFEKAAVLTVDGVGEWATATISRADGSKIEMLREMNFPNSIGLLYSAFTQFTGFKVNSGEYKMMGLAPYGKPIYVDTILENIVTLHDDGSVSLKMDKFAFLTEPTMTNEKFAELFGGPARKPESKITQREMDIARSIQVITEMAVLRMADTAHELTGEKYLCMAGGVALNCVANGRLLREGPFEDIWIQPAAGDSGAALGAALDAYHNYFDQPRVIPESGALQGGSYFGPQYSENEIEAYLDLYDFPYKKLDKDERPKVLAELLNKGKVVGHFAGRSEYGPRALGSRSIIGDARNQEMQVTMNLKIKYRESFRPFAPTVMAERVSEYFDLDRESPYMLIVAPVHPKRQIPFELSGSIDDMLEIVRQPRSDIPAITHIDHSARVQSIRQDHHPKYYNTIKAFEDLTGYGVIVNTSFNVRGEPIVNSPEDAYRCFMRTEMDILILEDYILYKEDQPEWAEPKGHIDEYRKEEVHLDPKIKAELQSIFEKDFLQACDRARQSGDYRSLTDQVDGEDSTWLTYTNPRKTEEFSGYPLHLNENGKLYATEMTDYILSHWDDKTLAEQLRPVLLKLFGAVQRVELDTISKEEISDTMYVMF
ncbi:hypothetical protein K8I28_11545 [bacterium]|nr:hypothetical protein [bacterium]